MDVFRGTLHPWTVFRNRRPGGEGRWWNAGGGMTLLELLVAVVVLGVLLAALLSWLVGKKYGGSGRPSTQNTMKQWGLVFKMYANESKGGRYPTLASVPGVWAPDLSCVFPEYLSDPALLVSPEHPEAEHLEEVARAALGKELLDFEFAAKVMGQSFAYFSHIALNEAVVMTLREERRAGRLTRDDGRAILEPGRCIIPLRGAPDCNFLGRMPQTVRPWVGSQSELPVLVEVACWRSRDTTKAFRGTDVLYMDGHVAFVPLGTFPIVPEVMDKLCEVGELRE